MRNKIKEGELNAEDKMEESEEAKGEEKLTREEEGKKERKRRNKTEVSKVNEIAGFVEERALA